MICIESIFKNVLASCKIKHNCTYGCDTIFCFSRKMFDFVLVELFLSLTTAIFENLKYQEIHFSTISFFKITWDELIKNFTTNWVAQKKSSITGTSNVLKRKSEIFHLSGVNVSIDYRRSLVYRWKNSSLEGWKWFNITFLSLLRYLIYDERIPYFRRIMCYETSEVFKNPP